MTVAAKSVGDHSAEDGSIVDVLGCPFHVVSFQDVLDTIERALTAKKRLQIVPGNVDFVMKASRDDAFRQLLHKIDLVVADGVPITWAAMLLGTPLKGRVSGTDLVFRCGEISARLKTPVALVGAAPGVAQRAADRMMEAFPGSMVHAIATPMQLDDAGSSRVVEEVSGLNASILLAALGAPRQERWLHQYLPRSGAIVGIGVGSALDIICGDKPRAPAWMADNGLEWFHRMLQEPRRLGRRYLVEDSGFGLLLAKELLRRRARRS
jgi:N-acetylglucosaminyldiphosphoundecaprenol N-acetyl-beta-D-mannosaminyltransferase